MSIALAMVTRRDAVAASDGRRFNSAQIQNGICTVKARLDRDDFDKTFAVCSGKVVGAFAGLVEFSGLTIGAHVTEIVDSSESPVQELEDIAAVVGGRLADRLLRVSDTESLLEHRRVDILLAGGRDLARRDFEIRALRFGPAANGSKIHCSQSVERCAGGAAWHSCRFGEEQAVAAMDRYLGAIKSRQNDRDAMAALAANAVRAGIANAGATAYHDGPVCGGEPFVRLSWY